MARKKTFHKTHIDFHFFKCKTKTKLSSGKGESLVETLVSILVISISLLMLASAGIASKNLLEHTNRTIQAYLDANSSFEGSSSKKGDGVMSIKDLETSFERGIFQGYQADNRPKLYFYTNQTEEEEHTSAWPILVRYEKAH